MPRPCPIIRREPECGRQSPRPYRSGHDFRAGCNPMLGEGYASGYRVRGLIYLLNVASRNRVPV